MRRETIKKYVGYIARIKFKDGTVLRGKIEKTPGGEYYIDSLRFKPFDVKRLSILETTKQGE